MKTSRNTPRQLVLDSTPWALAVGLVLFTLAFIAAGLFVLLNGSAFGLLFLFGGGGVGVACTVAFVERLQVVLNRDTNLLSLRRRTLLGYREERFALDRLERAIVQSSPDRQDMATTTRPALMLVPEGGGSAEARPITHVYSSGRGAKRTATAINTWLKRK